MKLLTAAPSPFGRKVMVLLHETGQLDAVEVQLVAASPVATPADLAAANPMGKIPALIREGGPALYDSRVICRFLDAQTGGALYPEVRIWDTLTLEATADGIMDAAVLIVYEGRMRPEAMRYAPWIEAQWAKVDRSLDALEARWMSHLAGSLDMGQIAVACALSYLDFRHAERDWRAARPQLAAWHGVFSKRASMEATRPD